MIMILSRLPKFKLKSKVIFFTCLLHLFYIIHSAIAAEENISEEPVISESPQVAPLFEAKSITANFSEVDLDDSKINKMTNVKDIFNSTLSTLEHFDLDKDERLNLEEFGNLCDTLFTNGKVDNQTVSELFRIFDGNQNGYICKDDLDICFKSWILPTLKPTSVFVIVDVQNDFISGSLALRNAPGGQEGEEVVPVINDLLEKVVFSGVFYTLDWHPSNHISFVENVFNWPLHSSSKIQDPSEAKVLSEVIFEGSKGQLVKQILWPKHCVQGTEGAKLHKDLKVIKGKNVKEVYKGLQTEVDSYSAFLDNDKQSMTPLKEYIEEVVKGEGKDRLNAIVFVAGLALDICVGATAEDSLNLGWRTVLVEDASRGVDLEGVEKTKKKLEGIGGVVVKSGEVKAIVEGEVRMIEMGLKLANELKKGKKEVVGGAGGGEAK